MSIPISRTLEAGALSGVLGGIIANFAHVLFAVPQGLYFPELAPLRVFAAVLLVNLGAAFLFRNVADRPDANRRFGVSLASAAISGSLLLLVTHPPAHAGRVYPFVFASVALAAYLIIPKATRTLVATRS
ncbi:MAG: hypothetical protein JST92_24125 [Deltaproteobacteria bacterium]|nr:hypothetical protein [Deltaproteobacteria bacterium]